MIRITFVNAAGVIQKILSVTDERMVAPNSPPDLLPIYSVPDDLTWRWNGVEWVAPG